MMSFNMKKFLHGQIFKNQSNPGCGSSGGDPATHDGYAEAAFPGGGRRPRKRVAPSLSSRDDCELSGDAGGFGNSLKKAPAEVS
jgi:hypothetical protein